ncbi:MAG: hypothetical protein EOP56_06670 [Sphingobacteriales bacterium]|nr:MAG: hypothetical protein EOP56_06670 [Sphingobacteriales bacterium]
MNKDEQLAFLTKFRWIDKYKTFAKVLPLATITRPQEKEIVTGILDACCNDLIALLKQQSKPGKMAIRQAITIHMDELARAGVCHTNKDFGYELFWYLGEKMDIDLKRSSHAKVWGYWKVEANKVVAVSGSRKRKTTSQQA